jgi:hypothetical protein
LQEVVGANPSLHLPRYSPEKLRRQLSIEQQALSLRPSLKRLASNNQN